MSRAQDPDMLPAQDLPAILAKVRSLRSDLEALRKLQKAFAIRTANEIDELFAKVEATGPTRQETGSPRQRRSFANSSVTLTRNYGNDVTLLNEWT